MDLKQFLSKGGKSSNEYFWALVIEPGWVHAGTWRIEDEVARIVSSGQPTAWELTEDLVSAADTALSVALQTFPETDAEPSKTVFGVVSSWVSGGQIKPEYLDRVKKICSELSLVPVGFVVIPEAIAHFLKSEEGSPLNAVVIGAYKEVIEISVFKLGNLIGTTQVARSVSIVDDVCEGLSRFKGQDAIPSRFILYNGKEGELEEVRQALLKVNWDDFTNLKFLHTPKVETISSTRKVYAVSLAGASELADVISIAISKPEIKEKEEEEVKETSEIISEEAEVLPEELGFELERDVAKIKREGEEIHEEEPQKEDYSLNNVAPVSTEKPKAERSFLGILGKAFAHLPSFGKKLFSIKTSFAATGRKTVAFGLGFLILILAVGFLVWLYLPRAVITIYVSPKKLAEKTQILIDPKAEAPNLSERILPSAELKTGVSGDKTKSTTGTKTVGDKAKGEVVLYRVGPQLTLPVGTLLYGPENMKFSLDAPVGVASGSASTPGTTKAAISAENIGAQHNLAGGASFKVGNYSINDIEAKNETAFSGGSSREISAVSADDAKILQDELEEELKEKAANELTLKLSEDKVIIPESISATASSRNFSNKVGDEASSLKLSLTLDASALAVDKNQLLNLAMEALKDKVPEGFVLREEQVEVEFGGKKEENGVYQFSGSIEANLLPEIDPEGIAKKVAGKYPAVAEEVLLREIPSFVRAEIRIRPHLPGRLGSLPRLSKHIDVVISVER